MSVVKSARGGRETSPKRRTKAGSASASKTAKSTKKPASNAAAARDEFERECKAHAETRRKMKEAREEARLKHRVLDLRWVLGF